MEQRTITPLIGTAQILVQETSQVRHCPSDDQLHRLLSVELADDDRLSLERHIEACADCRQKLRSHLFRLGDSHFAAMSDRTNPFLSDVLFADKDAGEIPATIRYLGDYELLDKIAEGGMGVVCKARQRSLNRLVAIKLISAAELATDEHIARFQREAMAAAKVRHPNIVAVHEIGVHNERHYISMDFIDGRSLESYLLLGPLPPMKAVELLIPVTAAVQYAHEHGVIHRDLKPSNILLDEEGVPHVTDFGVAKILEDVDALTRSGQVIGTPCYMAPEQAMPKLGAVGPSADVYALGALLYCMLTGRPPFQSDNVLDTLRQVVETDAVPIRQLNPKVDCNLETICHKCLEKEPSKRYATAGEVAEELGRVQLGEPIHARPVGMLERAWRWCKRNSAIASLAALAASLLVVGTIVSTALAISAGASREIAEVNKEVAVEQRLIAEERLSFAQRQIDQFLGMLSSIPREHMRVIDLLHLKDLEEELSHSIKTYYGDLQGGEGLSDPGVFISYCRTLKHLVEIKEETGSVVEDVLFEQYRDAITSYEVLIERVSEKDDHLYDLAAFYRGLGRICLIAGHTEAAENALQNCLDRLGAMERADDRNALYIRLDVADAYNDLGMTYLVAGEYDRSEEFFNRSLELRDIRDTPDDELLKYLKPLNTLSKAATKANLGSVHRPTGRLQLAEETIKEGQAILHAMDEWDKRFLQEEYAEEYYSASAFIHHQLSTLYIVRHNFSDARAAAIESVEACQHLDLKVIAHRVRLMEAYRNLAIVYQRLGQGDAARENVRNAMALFEQLGDEQRQRNGISGKASSLYAIQAWLLLEDGEFDAALPFFEQALQIKDNHSCDALMGSRETYVGGLYMGLGWACEGSGQYERGLAAFDEALEYDTGAFGEILQIHRLVCLAASGQTDPSILSFLDVARRASATKQPPSRFTVAEFWAAVAVGCTPDTDAEPSAESRQERANNYTERATKWLQEAKAAGELDSPENMLALRKSAVFRTIRETQAFAELVNGVE